MTNDGNPADIAAALERERVVVPIRQAKPRQFVSEAQVLAELCEGYRLTIRQYAALFKVTAEKIQSEFPDLARDLRLIAVSVEHIARPVGKE